MAKAYSADLKWRIIYLHIKGYLHAKISYLFWVSIGLVSKVVQLYKKWGCVASPFYGLRGRRKTLQTRELKVCIAVFIEYSFLYQNCCKNSVAIS